MEKRNREIWSYYLLLEDEICEIEKYIEFSSANFKTYSNFNAKCILSICSEIDVLLKEYCTLLDNTKTYDNMGEYRKCIASKNPNLSTQEINLFRYGITITPWNNVNILKSSIKWWKDYNDIKHNRLINYNLATLKNVIESCAALHCLVVNLIRISEEKKVGSTIEYRDITYDLLPEPKMFKFSDDSYYYNKLKMFIV